MEGYKERRLGNFLPPKADGYPRIADLLLKVQLGKEILLNQYQRLLCLEWVFLLDEGLVQNMHCKEQNMLKRLEANRDKKS